METTLQKPTSDIIQQIVELFIQNIKGREVCLNNKNKKHCGKEGHWLEAQMGLKHNSKNEPDIYGYEMKKSSPKTTLGDYSASEYAFSKKNKHITIRDCFIKITEIY